MSKYLLACLIIFPSCCLASQVEMLGFLDLTKTIEKFSQVEFLLQPTPLGSIKVAIRPLLRKVYAGTRVFGLAAGSFDERTGTFTIQSFEPRVYDPLNGRFHSSNK